MRPRTRRIASAVALVVSALLAATPAHATTTTFTVRNDLATTPGYLGTNAVYMDFTEFPEMSTRFGMTSGLKTVEYDRVSNAGLKVARTWFGLDWVQPSWPTFGSYSFSNTNFNAFRTWLTEMQSRGIDVALQFGWNWTRDLCGVGGVGCTPDVGDVDVRNFADLVSKTLNQLINVDRFTNVKYVLLFAEPTTPAASLPARTPAWTSSEYYVHVANAVNSQIVADDASRTAIRPKIRIIGPQASKEQDGSDTYVRYVYNNTSGVFDGYSEHEYCHNDSFGACFFFTHYKTIFSGYKADVGGAPFWIDELGNFGTGTVGIADDSAARHDGIYGTWLANVIGGLINGGMENVNVWALQDMHFPTPNLNYAQRWGLARWPGDSVDVWPAWYAYSLLSNLLGGGRNSAGTATQLIQSGTSTDLLNITSMLVPNGIGGCAILTGCTSMMVDNLDAVPHQVAINFGTAQSSHTYYRYVFNGWNVPEPYPSKAAYRLPWDRTFTGVTTGIPTDTVPANSVVVYSDINLTAPAATNLAPSATAVASSTDTTGGYAAAAVNDRDNTQHAIAAAGWRPSPSATGTQTIELDWASAQTINRLELDFVDTSTLGTYTIRYWNGSAWVALPTAVSVTSNTQAHRTHTFAAISTSKVRVEVAAATTAPINEIGVYDDATTVDTSLGFRAMTDNSVETNNKYDYETISNQGYTFQAGDRVEYDVKLFDNLDQIGGLDVGLTTSPPGCGSNAFRGTPGSWPDQNGVLGVGTGGINTYGYNTTYHRVLPIPSCAVGATSNKWMLVSEQDRRDCQGEGAPPTRCEGYLGVPDTAFYDDIVVKHSDGTVAATIYANGAPDTIKTELNNLYTSNKVWVTPDTAP